MKTTLPLILSLLLILSTGCAHIEYAPFAGQQGENPISTGAFKRVAKGMPIYHGYPERPYQLLGHVTLTGDPGAFDQQMIWTARKYQADAVLLQGQDQRWQAGSVGSGSAYSANGYSVGSGFSTAIMAGQRTAILIRFNDPPHTVLTVPKETIPTPRR